MVATAVMLGGSALPAKALLGVETPPVPKPGQVQTLALSLVPATPTVTPPDIDPQNPQIPNLPYVAVPNGLTPAMGVLSPTTVVSCQASYLGPLAAIVAMTAAFDAAGIEPPVQPSFLNPLFSPVTSACVIAPFPAYKTCKQDRTLGKNLSAASDDPWGTAPAPVASVAVIVVGADKAVSHYVYNNTVKPKVSKSLGKTLKCQAE